jgi:hypothetical protein
VDLFWCGPVFVPRENAGLCFLGGLAIKSESDCRRYSGASQKRRAWNP